MYSQSCKVNRKNTVFSDVDDKGHVIELILYPNTFQFLLSLFLLVSLSLETMKTSMCLKNNWKLF